MKKAVRDTLSLLRFRLEKPGMLGMDNEHLILGLIGTWIVGIGRYWDDPGANLLQHLGLGSVIYIFVLAALVWLIVKPFQIKHWTYFRVLTFISLTSFPAIFYAIPVEQFMSIAAANTVNVWFLAIVASWRFALLIYFMNRFTGLGTGNIFIITLLPVTAIIASLTALNLHRVVFQIMGGIREETAHDQSYFVLLVLTTFSVMAIGPLIIGYIVGIVRHRKKGQKSKQT
ncbi:MAG: hypothetical protein AAFY71_02125 [Bacteroidota bacterium]